MKTEALKLLLKDHVMPMTAQEGMSALLSLNPVEVNNIGATDDLMTGDIIKIKGIITTQGIIPQTGITLRRSTKNRREKFAA